MWWRIKQKEWKPWVGNRVTETRNLVQTSNWRYTQTKKNSADLLMRKADPSALINNEMWAKGPAFRRKSEDYWEFIPVDDVEHAGAKMEEKRKNVITMSAFSSTVPRIGNIIDCTKYNSCLSKLLRITTYIVKFVRNLKTTVTKDRHFRYWGITSCGISLQ